MSLSLSLRALSLRSKQVAAEEIQSKQTYLRDLLSQWVQVPAITATDTAIEAADTEKPGKSDAEELEAERPAESKEEGSLE
jgi:hypothetical protein